MNEHELQVLLDKQAIIEVIYTYCRALDRMDRDLASTLWHDDGTADWGPMFQGSGKGFIDWVWEQHAAMDRHSHQITNILIEVDGDTATSEAYVIATIRTRGDDAPAVDIIPHGRYLDRWSRRGGRWAIDHRQFVDDLTILMPVADDSTAWTAASTSRRDRDDPSYAYL